MMEWHANAMTFIHFMFDLKVEWIAIFEATSCQLVELQNKACFQTTFANTHFAHHAFPQLKHHKHGYNRSIKVNR